MTELTHPGHISHEVASQNGFSGITAKLKEVRGGRKFQDFGPFISTEGLNKSDASLFRDFLKKLYEKSGDYWEPGNCTMSLSLERAARSVAGDLKTKDSKITIKPKRFSRLHYWLEMKINEGDVLVIDPFGVHESYPQEISDPQEKILPYFGPISKARASARIVYEKGAKLDDWGTRAFPPGFHP